MGDVLSKAGYATGYWGKWGYGGSSSRKSPTLDNIQTLPTSHGYQYVVAELHHVRAHTFFQPTLWNAPAKPGTKGGLELKPNSMAKYTNNKAYPNYPASQNHPDYPKVAYCDDVYAFAALDFVRRQAVRYNKSREPFFGLFAAQIPHAPFAEVQKLPDWDQAYKNKLYFPKLSAQSKQWCAMVTRIDAHFGNLLDALDDPNGDGDKSDSVAQDTLVVFQSDNGGPRGSNREELDANGGLLGSKGSIFEGGIRVPTIAWWPGAVKAGSADDHQWYFGDCMATFAELAGTKVPDDIDSDSFLPTLRGNPPAKQWARKSRLYWEFLERGSAQAVRFGKWKAIRQPMFTGPIQLYDLSFDHEEKRDHAKSRPDLVKHAANLLDQCHEPDPNWKTPRRKSPLKKSPP